MSEPYTPVPVELTDVTLPTDDDEQNAATYNTPYQQLANGITFLNSFGKRYQRITSSTSTTSGSVRTTDGTIILPGSGSGTLIVQRDGASDNGTNGVSVYETFCLDPTHTTTVRDNTSGGTVLAVLGGTTSLTYAKYAYLSGAWVTIVSNVDHSFKLLNIYTPSTANAIAFSLASSSDFTPLLDSGSTAISFTLSSVKAYDRIRFKFGPFQLAPDNASELICLRVKVVQGATTTYYSLSQSGAGGTWQSMQLQDVYTSVSADAITMSVECINNVGHSSYIYSPRSNGGIGPYAWGPAGLYMFANIEQLRTY